MRQLAYFVNNLSGMNFREAWRKAGVETTADKPRLIDRRMDSEEWDDWPYADRKWDTSHRKTIWQILIRKNK